MRRARHKIEYMGFKIKSFIKKTIQNVKGFTLIEVAVSILIVGLVAAPMFMYMDTRQEQKKIVDTYEGVQSASNLLQAFRAEYGAYPCPAPMTGVSRDDPAYGRATEVPGFCAPIAARPDLPGGDGFQQFIGDLAMTSGSCSQRDGICIEDSIRTDFDPDTPGNQGDRVVLTGSLPFRDLQLEESQTLDAYGNKLVYAVTRSMTNAFTFDETRGGIRIIDEDGVDLTQVPGSAAFAILSSGKNAFGAYNSEGVRTSRCINSFGINALERENCFDSGNLNTATFRAAQRNSVDDTADEFDDEVAYFTSFQAAHWRRIPDNTENAQDLSSGGLAIGGSGQVDVGVDLQVVGQQSPAIDALRAYGVDGTDGKILVNNICDEEGLNCFSPEDLEMSCPGPGDTVDKIYMVGISERQPVCVATLVMGCDPGSSTPVLAGQNDDGTPICVPFPGVTCEAETITLCSQSVMLPERANNALYPVSSDRPPNGSVGAALGSAPPVRAGYTIAPNAIHYAQCKLSRYKCESGTWVPESNSGQCNQTAPLDTPSCRRAGSIHAGCGYDAGDTYDTERECTDWGQTGGTNTFSTACFCQAETCDEEVEQCSALRGPYWTGTYVTRVSAAPTSAGSSQCTYTPEPGYPIDNCVCTPPPGFENGEIDNQPLGGGCPDGYAGDHYQPRTFNVAACEWEDVGGPVDTCACDTDEDRREEPASCPSVCDEPDPAYPKVSIYQRNTDNGACSALEFVDGHLDNRPGECRPRSFTWQGWGGNGNPDSNWILGASCSCAEHAFGPVTCVQGPCSCLPSGQ